MQIRLSIVVAFRQRYVRVLDKPRQGTQFAEGGRFVSGQSAGRVAQSRTHSTRCDQKFKDFCAPVSGRVMYNIGSEVVVD